MVCISCGLDDTQTTVVRMYRPATVSAVTGDPVPALDIMLCLACYKARTGRDYNGDPTQ